VPDLNQLLTNLDILLDYAIKIGDKEETVRIRNRMAELINLIK